MEFRILGPIEVSGAGGSAPLRGGKQLALLSALLIQANRAVPADQLIEAIWGQRPPETAGAALQTYVFRLRSALAGAERGAEERIVTHRSSGYLIRLDANELDLTRFRAHQARGRAAVEAGALDEAGRELRAALELWRGPALAGVPGAFAQRHTTSLSEEYQTTLEQRIEVDLDTGKGVELVPELRKLVDTHPLRDRLYRHLMLALYRSDRRGEALETFRQARQTLVNELGIEPSSELQSLHQEILDTTQSPAKPTVTNSAPRPAAAPTPVPRQIPADIASFTGRGDYLTSLDRLTERRESSREAVSITTITGSAGVGKTALAVRWAHRVREEFPDGQLYVNLRGYGPTAALTAGDVLAGFLRALGVSAERLPLEQDERAGLFRSLLADKRVLVLLDNAATAEQVRPLLPGSPTCQVVITSRDDLRGLSAAHDAQRLVLDALTDTEAIDLLSRTLGAERVEADRDSAMELARLCAFLPLALRIAAANLADRPGLNLAEATAELASGDRLDQLEVFDDPTLAVRAALGHSYARLDPAAQRLFRLLGLVPGSDFTPEAIAALADLSRRDSARLLARLGTAHLVESHTAGRYQFHDLLRDYARERVEEEDNPVDRHTAIENLLDWYLHIAFAATQVLNPHNTRIFQLDALPDADRRVDFATYEQAMTWCENERTNLVAATELAADAGLHTIAWQLPASVWYFFFLRKYLADWVRTHELGHSAARKQGEKYGQAWMLNGLAGALRELRRFEESADRCRQALELSGEIGDRRGESANLTNLGWAYQRMGQPDEAADCYLKALAIRREIGDRWGEAANLTLLGQMHEASGALDEALSSSRQALSIWKELGALWGTGSNLDNLGAVYRRMGLFDQAVDHYQQALEVRRKAGDAWGEAETLASLGGTLSSDGQPDRAKECWQRALALFEDFGHPRAQEARSALASLDAVN